MESARIVPLQSGTTPTNDAIATADTTVFTLSPGEVGFIQNLDDAALAVKLGASAATNSFSMILQAGSAQDDGKGGFTYITDYTGVVSVKAMTGSPRYIAWKRALG